MPLELIAVKVGSIWNVHQNGNHTIRGISDKLEAACLSCLQQAGAAEAEVTGPGATMYDDPKLIGIFRADGTWL